ncbi:MAG: hypothetical protein J3R72DRAFT_514006, partial [Linnemannia gamsii]
PPHTHTLIHSLSFLSHCHFAHQQLFSFPNLGGITFNSSFICKLLRSHHWSFIATPIIRSALRTATVVDCDITSNIRDFLLRRLQPCYMLPPPPMENYPLRPSLLLDNSIRVRPSPLQNSKRSNKMSLSSMDNPLVQASPTATFWKPAEPEKDVLTFVYTPRGQPKVCSEESLSMSKYPGEPPPLSVSPDESLSTSVSADEERVIASIGDDDYSDLAKESTKEQAYDEAQPHIHPLQVNDLHTPVGPGPSLNSVQHHNESLRLEFLRHGAFPRNTPKPTIISSVPIPIRTQVESSLQLVGCLSLLSEDPPLYLIGDRDDRVENNDPSWPWRSWLDEMRQRPAEQGYLRQLVSRMVQVFVESSNKSNLIDEVTILGPALNRVDMNTLLMCLINSPERFEKWSPLDSYLLPAITRLIQTASPGVLTNTVVVEILGIFQYSRVLYKSDVHQLVAKILEWWGHGSGSTKKLPTSHGFATQSGCRTQRQFSSVQRRLCMSGDAVSLWQRDSLADSSEAS